MKIISHFPAGVETIKVNQEDKKVTVETQSYSPTLRDTKYYTRSYEFGGVPAHIWIKIKEEKLRIEEDEEERKNTKIFKK